MYISSASTIIIPFSPYLFFFPDWTILKQILGNHRIYHFDYKIFSIFLINKYFFKKIAYKDPYWLLFNFISYLDHMYIYLYMHICVYAHTYRRICVCLYSFRKLQLPVFFLYMIENSVRRKNLNFYVVTTTLVADKQCLINTCKYLIHIFLVIYKNQNNLIQPKILEPDISFLYIKYSKMA